MTAEGEALTLEKNFRWAEVQAPEAQEEIKMAFSRSFLKTCGLTDEQITAVMEAHTEVTDSLKQQRDSCKADAEKYKADADKLPGVQKQLDDLKGGENYKAKYETEHQAFEAYKQQAAEKEQAEKVKAAYRNLLKEAKVSDKYLDTVIAATQFGEMKLDKDGKLENADNLKKSAAEKWADFVTKTRERGPKTETPPYQDNGGAGDNEIRAMGERRRAARYGAIPGAQNQEKG